MQNYNRPHYSPFLEHKYPYIRLTNLDCVVHCEKCGIDFSIYNGGQMDVENHLQSQVHRFAEDKNRRQLGENSPSPQAVPVQESEHPPCSPETSSCSPELPSCSPEPPSCTLEPPSCPARPSRPQRAPRKPRRQRPQRQLNYPRPSTPALTTRRSTKRVIKKTKAASADDQVKTNKNATKSKKNRKTSAKKCSTTTTKTEKLPKQMNLDEDALYGQYITSRLKHLNVEEKFKVKHKIDCLLFNVLDNK